MPAPFTLSLRVRFHQADPAGVLFYGRLFELVEEAYEAFCRHAGLDIDAWMRQDGTTTPVKRVEADYRAPIAVGALLRIEVRVARIGASSFTMAYTFLGEDGEARASAEVVHVHVDAERWTKAPLPDDLRVALERHAGT